MPRPPITRDHAVYIVLCALLGWVAAFYLGQAFTRPPDFDGALNFNVSRSLLEGHGYSAFYETRRLFPIETQTNGPLVVPAAGSMALFGRTAFAFQAVNLAYLLAFCVLAGTWLRRIGAGKALVAAGLLLALQVPGMSDYALNGYGEIPALAWMFAALLALARQFETPRPLWPLLGGLALGVSFLTKTVALIWFPPLIGVFLALRWQRDGLSAALRDALFGALGILAALAAWEAYRMASLGGPREWHGWWNAQYEEVQKQAGVSEGYLDTPGVFAKARHHGAALLGMLGLPAWAGLAWILAGFASAAAALRAAKDARVRFLVAAPLLVAALYFVWWIQITPTEFMWLRRILPGLVLLVLLVPAAVALLHRHPSRALRGLAWTTLALGAALAFSNQLLWQRPDARSTAVADEALYAALRALPPDALTFGSGWWQAPVAALYTGRDMHNEENWDEARLQAAGRPAYLVMDHYAVAIGAAMRERIAWRCDCVPEYIGPGGRIYRIRHLYEAPETSRVRTARIDAAMPVAGEGFEPEEGGVRWVRERARLALPDGPHATYVLDYVVPGLEMYDTPLPRLSISRGDCLLVDLPLLPGPQGTVIRDECPAGSNELRFETRGKLDPAKIAPDTRPLAWLFRGLELYPAE